MRWFDKCLNRRHTRWMRMTPTPCPTRHLSHHWIMANANKRAERTKTISREMMNLPFLKTSETTSINTDETRHPSVKKSPPTRKQVSDGNVIHHTRLTNHDINNLDRTAHGSGQNFKTERRHTTHPEKILHEPKKPQHNTVAAENMLRDIDCKTTSVDELWITCHLRFRAESLDSQTSFNYGQSIIVPHQRQTSSSTDIPTPRAPQRSITNFHIFETTHVGNMWNSGWNSTLTLIHRCPDSIVLQPHPPQTQIIQCSCSNTTTILNNANMTRIDRATKHLGHRIHSQESQ